MSSRSQLGVTTPGDLLSGLFRHRVRVGAFVLLTLATTAAVILWFPRQYQSQAELFVRVGRESVTLDPTATTGQTVSLLDSRENEINSVVEVLRSRAIAEKVVDRLTPSVVLHGPASKETAIADKPAEPSGGATAVVASLASYVGSIDPVDDRERAVQELVEKLNVYSARDSSVISIRYLDDDPAQAQQVLAGLLDAYMTEHMRINRTHGSLEFFESQTKLMEAKWRATVEQVRDVKNTHGLASVEGKRALLQEQETQLNMEMVLATTALKSAEAKAKELERVVAQMPASKVIETEDGHANEALDRMREQFFVLELREKEMLTKLTDAHPQVIAIRDQVAQAREILETQEQRRTFSKTAPNPAREKLELDLKAERAEAQGLIARSAILQTELAQVHSAVEQLNHQEVQLTQLQQEADLAHRNYVAHADKLEQARIHQALDRDRISNVNIVQAASFEPKPASPRKGIVAAAGLATAMLGSLLIVLMSEQLDRSLRSPGDIEQQLDLPVLVSLPRTSGHRVAASNN